MKPSKLLYIDDFLAVPNRIMDGWYSRFRKRVSPDPQFNGNILILKLMGMGSLIKLAKIFQENGVDFSKTTLCTFKHNQEIAEILGFKNVILIPTSGFQLIWKCLMIPFHNSYKTVYDAERDVNATSILRKYLSVWGKSISISYTNKGDSNQANDHFFSLENRSHSELYQVILPFLKKTVNDSVLKVQNRGRIEKNILININASDYLNARKFPVEKFERLIEELASKYRDHMIVLTGSNSEKDYVETLEIALARKKIIVENSCGKWSLKQLKNELERSALFITNDSGPMHLAIWVKVPTICIWGPTQASYSGYPESETVRNVSLNLSCSPCFFNAQSKWGGDCNKKITCLSQLETRQIVNVVNEIIKE